MTPPVPTRITIELHPADGAGTWTARASGEQAASGEPGIVVAVTAEPRHAAVSPEPYEAEECTCHEGLCGRDHDDD